MDNDFDAVIAGERTLLEPDVRADADAVRALLHDDFSEFGASGAVWDRASVVRATHGDSGEGTIVDDLRPVRLDGDTILLTYTARRTASASLRTSIWVRVERRWLLRHHQGTRTNLVVPKP